MSFPHTFIQLSVRRGIRSRDEWEKHQQDIIDSPTTPEHVREHLIKCQQARKEAGL